MHTRVAEPSFRAIRVFHEELSYCGSFVFTGRNSKPVSNPLECRTAAFNRLTLDLHRFDEIGGRCSFERQSVANFPHNTLFQGLNEMYARIAAGHFGSLQVQLRQFPCPTERLTVRHNLRDHAPFVCSARSQRLWVEQERLRSSRSGAITPRSKDSVAGHNASREV